MVEITISIKTLDSRVHHLKVPRNISVPELKDKIAKEIGVSQAVQRLIFQGKVLKDDKDLTFYQVEDGHTLHLVERPPAPQTSNAQPQPPTTIDTTAQSQSNRAPVITPNVMLGAITIPDGAEGDANINQIVNNVLGSLGLPPITPANAAGPAAGAAQTPPQQATDSIDHLWNLLHTLENTLAGTTAGTPAPATPSAGNTIERLGRLLGGVDSTLATLRTRISTLSQLLANESNLPSAEQRQEAQSLAALLGTALQQSGSLMTQLAPQLAGIRMGEAPGQAVSNAPSVLPGLGRGSVTVHIQQHPVLVGTAPGGTPNAQPMQFSVPLHRNNSNQPTPATAPNTAAPSQTNQPATSAPVAGAPPVPLPINLQSLLSAVTGAISNLGAQGRQPPQQPPRQAQTGPNQPASTQPNPPAEPIRAFLYQLPNNNAQAASNTNTTQQATPVTTQTTPNTTPATPPAITPPTPVPQTPAQPSPANQNPLGQLLGMAQSLAGAATQSGNAGGGNAQNLMQGLGPILQQLTQTLLQPQTARTAATAAPSTPPNTATPTTPAATSPQQAANRDPLSNMMNQAFSELSRALSGSPNAGGGAANPGEVLSGAMSQVATALQSMAGPNASSTGNANPGNMLTQLLGSLMTPQAPAPQPQQPQPSPQPTRTPPANTNTNARPAPQVVPQPPPEAPQQPPTAAVPEANPAAVMMSQMFNAVNTALASGSPMTTLQDVLNTVVPCHDRNVEGEGPLSAMMDVIMKSLTIPDLLKIYNGDWSPVQKLQSSLAEHLQHDVLMGDTSQTRLGQFADHVIDSLKETINDNTIPPELRARIKPGCNLPQVSLNVIKLHTIKLLQLILKPNPQQSNATQPGPPSFANVVRAWTAGFIVDLVNSLAAILVGGVEDALFVVKFFVQERLVFLGPEFAPMATTMLSSYIISTYNTAQRTTNNNTLANTTTDPQIPNEWRKMIIEDELAQQNAPAQRPLSQSYLQGAPNNKRRRTGKRGNVKTEDPEKMFAERLQEAVTTSNVNTNAQHLASQAASQGLHNQYAQQVNQDVANRLQSDSDYDPAKFPNSALKFIKQEKKE